MAHIPALAVFCGGSTGNNPIWMEQAYLFGKIIAENKTRLIYGAGGTGLMGAVAKGALDENGDVIGATIWSLYDAERPDLVAEKVHRFEVWSKLAYRKISMTRQSTAVCVLPGGFGTMDELFELLTLRQLNLIKTPIVVVNIAGYFDGLKRWIEEMISHGFAKSNQMDLLTFVERVEDVFPTLEQLIDKMLQEENEE